MAYDEDHQDMNNRSLKMQYILMNNTVFDVVQYIHEVRYKYECIA